MTNLLALSLLGCSSDPEQESKSQKQTRHFGFPQWADLYENLGAKIQNECGYETVIDSYNHNVDIELPDGTYTIDCRTARGLYWNMYSDYDAIDQNPGDYHLDKPSMQRAYRPKHDGAYYSTVRLKVSSHTKNPDLEKLEEYLKPNKIVFRPTTPEADLVDTYTIIDGSPPEVFREAVLTAFYNGWTPESLERVKTQFENANAGPFYFSFEPHLRHQATTTWILPEWLDFADTLGIDTPSFFTVNVANKMEIYQDESVTKNKVTHETVHIALRHYFAQFNPEIFKKDNDKPYLDVDQFLSSFSNYLRHQNPQNQQSWDLWSKNGDLVFFAEEAMVVGFMMANKLASPKEVIERQDVYHHAEYLKQVNEKEGKQGLIDRLIPEAYLLALIENSGSDIEDFNKEAEGIRSIYGQDQRLTQTLEDVTELIKQAIKTLPNDEEFQKYFQTRYFTETSL